MRALWLSLLLALAGCAGAPQRPEVAGYVVRPGDTVYSIAARHGLDYHALARWNSLPADYAIRVGQHLVLAPPSGAPPSPAASAHPAPRAAGPVGVPLPPPAFAWPADGHSGGVIERPNGGFGLRIDGVYGEPVRAAAAGRVVYLGNGLRAYGLLVIIRHDEHYLTAYGNNATVTVAEGDAIAGGAVLGTMGTGSDGTPMLYFEIRADGRPVNPLALLPARIAAP